ncbi:hypothetical protein JOD01_001538 [Brevibacillus fulvus]|uniref:Uncharacterized protein n=1 Tax=Brevibacillus fulvus TaxID=1125967 RepID=A0A939BRS0_9BACL|nr:hypothetical protein [Brevibacillus fulvus]
MQTIISSFFMKQAGSKNFAKETKFKLLTNCRTIFILNTWNQYC